MEFLYPDFPSLTPRVVDVEELAKYKKYIKPEKN